MHQWSGWSLEASAPYTAHDNHQDEAKNETSGIKTPADRKAKTRAKEDPDVKNIRPTDSVQADHDNENLKRARPTKDDKNPTNSKPTGPAEATQDTDNLNLPKPKKRRKA